MAQGKFGGGTGLITDPYLIEDIADLNQIRVNPSLHYKMKYSVNAGVAPYNEGNGWNPISNFTGTLDGNGKKIFNLYINRPNEDNVGLFNKFIFFTNATYTPPGYVAGLTSATVRNMVKDLGLENVNIVGRNNVGGLVGLFSMRMYRLSSTTYDHEFTVKRTFVTGKVRGSSAVGGLIGYFHATNLYNQGWTSNQFTTRMNNIIGDIYTNCEINASNANINYSGVVGRYRTPTDINPGWDNNSTISTVIDTFGVNIITNSRFTSAINGLITHPIVAVNDGQTPTKIINSFYNTEAWGPGSNTHAVALTTEQMKRSTYLGTVVEQVNDFDLSQRTWTFERGRYPQLYFAIANNLFIKAGGKYYSLDEKGELVKKFDLIPSREEAMEHGFKDISKVSNTIWNQLRSQHSEVEIVNIIERASNVSNTLTTHQLEADATNSTEDNLVYRKVFNFADFHDGIAVIRTV